LYIRALQSAIALNLSNKAILHGNHRQQVLHIRECKSSIDHQIELLLSPGTEGTISGWHYPSEALCIAVQEELGSHEYVV